MLQEMLQESVNEFQTDWRFSPSRLYTSLRGQIRAFDQVKKIDLIRLSVFQVKTIKDFPIVWIRIGAEVSVFIVFWGDPNSGEDQDDLYALQTDLMWDLEKGRTFQKVVLETENGSLEGSGWIGYECHCER